MRPCFLSAEGAIALEDRALLTSLGTYVPVAPEISANVMSSTGVVSFVPTAPIPGALVIIGSVTPVVAPIQALPPATPTVSASTITSPAPTTGSGVSPAAATPVVSTPLSLGTTPVREREQVVVKKTTDHPVVKVSLATTFRRLTLTQSAPRKLVSF
jgi:hypothetical protein